MKEHYEIPAVLYVVAESAEEAKRLALEALSAMRNSPDNQIHLYDCDNARRIGEA